MSFWGGLVGAVKGAVVGFVTGGPGGAVVGAVGGAVSGSAGHTASQGGLDYVQPTYKPRAEDMYLYQPGYGSPAAAGSAYTQPTRGPRAPRGQAKHCVCRPARRSHLQVPRMGSGRRRIAPIYTRGGPGGWG